MRGIADAIAVLFYDRLFTLDPLLRRLFHGDMQVQGRQPMAMLTQEVAMAATIHHRTRRTLQTMRTWQSVRALLACGLDMLHLWQQRHRGRRDLLRLDDRLLKDIGLNRVEAAQEAYKPFWRL